MKSILWIITTTKDTPLTVQHAFHQAQTQDVQLVVLFVLDPKLKQQTESLFPSYEEKIEKKFSDIEMRSAGKNVAIKTLLREGDIAQECVSVIREFKPTEIIFTKMKGSQFSRFFFSTAADKVKTAAGCPVTVIEEKEG